MCCAIDVCRLAPIFKNGGTEFRALFECAIKWRALKHQTQPSAEQLTTKYITHNDPTTHWKRAAPTHSTKFYTVACECIDNNVDSDPDDFNYCARRWSTNFFNSKKKRMNSEIIYVLNVDAWKICVPKMSYQMNMSCFFLSFIFPLNFSFEISTYFRLISRRTDDLCRFFSFHFNQRQRFWYFVSFFFFHFFCAKFWRCHRKQRRHLIFSHIFVFNERNKMKKSDESLQASCW